MNEIAFISGHRDVTPEEFELHYKAAIDHAVAAEHQIVVCDYVGADRLAHDYLVSIGYPYVSVYHMFENPRYATQYYTVGGFQNDYDRDEIASRTSTYDILWVRPGREESWTAYNLKRRERQKCKNVSE